MPTPDRRDIDRHENEITKLWQQKASTGDVEALRDDFKEYKRATSDEVISLRRVIMGFALTVAAAAVTIAGTVLSSGGN